MSESRTSQSTIEYSVEAVVNLGDYNSIRFHFGVSDSPREGESVKQASERIRKFVSDTIASDIQEAHQSRS